MPQVVGGSSGSSSSRPSSSSTPTKKPSGFLHAVGDFFHGLLWGDPVPYLVGEKKPPGGLQGVLAKVGGALGKPIISPGDFLADLGNEVNEGLYKPIIGLFGERDVPLIGHVPKTSIPESFKSAIHPTGNEPLLRMVPGFKTVGDITHGRPVDSTQVILDALGLFGGEAGEVGRLPRVLRKGADLTKDVTDTLSKIPAGRRIVTSVSKRTARAREMFPTPRTPEIKRLPASQRRVENIVGGVIGEDLDAIAKMKLTEPERTSLRHDFLDRGVRPTEPRMAEAFDRIKAWSEDNRARKLEASIPEEVVQGLRATTEARLFGPVASIIGAEKAAAMFDAFKRGLDNPFPEESKAWRRIGLEHGKAVRSKLREQRLYEFDSGLPLHPEAARPALAITRQPGDWEIHVDRGGGYWALGKDPETPNLGPFPEARDAAVAIREQVRGTAPQPVRDLRTLGPEVYPWRKYVELKRAKARWERGEMPTDAYEALVAKNTPARYKPALADAQLNRQLAKVRQRYERGFGAAAAGRMVEDVPETWVSIKRDGVEPVWGPRLVKKTETEPLPKVGPEFSTAKPSSMKDVAVTEATMYHDDPVVMMGHDEFQLASQTVTQKAIAETARATGAKAYDRVLQGRLSEGYTRAQAEGLINDDWIATDLEGNLSKPAPGKMLVRRDVGKAIEHYTKDVMPNLVDEAFGMWMVPVLHLSPAFHLNNIVGGAFLTALKAHEGPLALLNHAREALELMRTGQMPVGIPLGMGQAPQIVRQFTRDSRLEEGTRLAKLWESIPGAGSVLEKAERLNVFFDSLYKTVTWLDEYYDRVKKGNEPWTARAQADNAASNLMQNWDAFTPIERQVIQRIYPFWGFRKAMIRTVMTYPMDHPFRMQFLYQLSRDAQEHQDLPEEWKYKLGIGGTTKDGKRTYISTQGLDPFADVSDVFTMRGFLHSVHPFVRTALEVFGVEGYRSGSPLFTRKGQADVDPYSGQPVRKFNPGAVINLVPQIEALALAVKARLESGVPPPEEDTRAGWLKWFDKYGSSLRITPGISYRSEQEAMDAFKRTQETVASFNKPKSSKRGSSVQPSIVGR